MTEQKLEELNLTDINLILSDQTDLYTAEELRLLKQRRDFLILQERLEKTQEKLEKIRKRETVICPKCEGPNEPQLSNCKFCNFRFRAQDYYFPIDGGSNGTSIHEPRASSSKGTVQLLLGLLLAGGGVIAIISGTNANNSYEAQINSVFNKGQSDPGTGLIILGISLAVVGGLFLISALFKKE